MSGDGEVLLRVSLLPFIVEQTQRRARTSSLACLVVMPVMCTRVRCRTRTLALFCMTASVSLRRLSLSFLAACSRFILRDGTGPLVRSSWAGKWTGDLLVRLDRLELDGRVIVRGPTRRTAVVQVLLDVVIAETTDLWYKVIGAGRRG